MIGITSAPRGFLDRHRAKIAVAAIAALCCLAGFTYASVDGSGIAGVFPDVKGWSKDGDPRAYDSETLYEYINGAADLYITYDFQELLTLNYEKGDDQGLAVDIYRHSTPRNGFGIYSQERPTEGNFVSIGTEGYYDQGILNFVMGSYYVKLAGFYLGDKDESLLTSVAEEIAGQLDEKAHTERYIAINFLGHSFLHSAYMTEYEAEGQKFKLFILEAKNEGDALGMVESYLKLARDKGEEVTVGEGQYRFKDPYYGSGGKMNLRQKGRYVWGLFSDAAPLYEFYLDEIGDALVASTLIEEEAKK
jgi:hypothetical protein